MDKNNFTLITHEDERNQVYDQAAQSKVDIACKGSSDQAFFIKVFEYQTHQKSFIGSLNTASVANFEKDCLISFMVNEKKYYSKAEIRRISGQSDLQIIITSPLYLLQRRQNYRTPIPKDVEAVFKIQKRNRQAQPAMTTLIDISSGGCKVTYKSTQDNLSIDDTLEGFLIVQGKTPIGITASVRHVAADPEKKDTYIVGLQFLNLDPLSESKLFSISMELSKQNFRRG